MADEIFSAWPYFSEDEIAASFKVLQSSRVNYWTGSEGKAFEKEFAEWIGSKFSIALANGSVALQLALQALKIGPGDDVVVTARTFIASASSVVICGARPVFADVDRDSQNITAESIKEVITPRTRAIMCVHLAGWPCEMDDIMALAKRYKIPVIEDCAQAHGASYKGRRVGSIGDIAAWSFCQDKIISTAGEGGMVTTNNEDLFKRVWSYKDHGKNIDKLKQSSQDSGYKWVHDSIGNNFRMTEIQSAIGRLQLKKMPEWESQRLQNARQIWKTASEIDLYRVPEIPSYINHAFYKCYVFLQPQFLARSWDRKRLIAKIIELGVPCYHGICPEIYLEKAFENCSNQPKTRLTTAKELGETSMMFLIHPTLTGQELQKTCDVIRKVAKMASRKDTIKIVKPAMLS